MPRTILVGLDGSPYSQAAVELGLRWASRSQALLVGLGVIDEPGIRGAQAVPLGGSGFKAGRDQTLVAAARHRIDQLLEQFALQCAEAGVACKLLEDVGMPSEQITLEAQRYDLILLGQRTTFRFDSQEGWDRTLENVLRASPRPVVTVPAQLNSSDVTMVAYDGSLQAARTLHALVSAGLTDGEVHVVCVHDDRVEAARRADRALDYLQFHGLKGHRHGLTPSKGIGELLLDQAASLGAGLLAMGAYGQPTLKEFFFGSVTQTLLKRSPIPLFLFH
jgi:nucleotide-binding universal stress UspA family protein